MARNRGKRPAGTSGPSTRGQHQTHDAKSQTSVPASKAGGDEVASGQAEKEAKQAPPKGAGAASSAIAAKIDPPASTAGKTTGKGEKTIASAQRSMPSTQSSASAPKSESTKSSSPTTSSGPRVGGSGAGPSGGAGGTGGAAASNGGGFWPGLIGGVIGGAATALAASLFWAGGDETSALQTTTAELENRIAATEEQVSLVNALDERVAAVEAAPAASVEGAGDIARQLADLETRFAALGDGSGGGTDDGLVERLASLEQQLQEVSGEIQATGEAQQASMQTLTSLKDDTLATLEQTLAATGQTVEQAGQETAALKQSLGGLSTTTEQLQGDVQALASRVGAAESELDHLGGEYQRGAAMIVAIGDVDRAITRAEPFDSSLQSLKSLLRDDAMLGETLSTLEPMAADGVPALDDLKNTYGDMASRTLLAEEGDRSLTDQVSDNLFGIVNMRPSGAEVEGSSSRAILSRGQAKLSNDDLEAAVAELSDLEGAAAEAATSWIERARARLDAEAAVVDLRSHAQSLVAKGS